MKGVTVTILVIIVLAAAGYLWMRDRDAALTPNNDETVFCTMDAMMCPNGSYVGRIPPNCEFAACPSTSTSTPTSTPTTTSTTSATVDLTI